MEKLYAELADIYQIMYQTFIPYDEEFAYYRRFLTQYDLHRILEIGCGSGNIARRMLDHGFDYLGMDISPEMLAIAQQQLPQGQFMEADMRNFKVKKTVEAALIIGRSLSYILSNADVLATFRAIHAALEPGGLLIFDVINAHRFIPNIRPEQPIIHIAQHEGQTYRRVSHWTVNAASGWTWDWQAAYFVENAEGNTRHIADDFTTLRTMTRDETEIFLHLSGFEPLEVHERPTYAFDTLVFVARKMN
jgi:SAM-dependent methyltransferase